MSLSEKFQEYINNQLSRDRDIVYAPYGDTPIDKKIIIPNGIRSIEARGTRFLAETRRKFCPLNIDGVKGLRIRDIELVDLSADSDTEKGGYPAILVNNSENIFIQGVYARGFGKTMVFRDCKHITIDACNLDKSWSWSVEFKNCKYINVINTMIQDPWLDAFKVFGSTDYFKFVNSGGINCGLSRDLDPKSNGNAIDTYFGGRHGKLINFHAEKCRGAGINIKGGPLDKENRVTGFIEITNATCIDNLHAGLDVNSASNGHISTPINVVVNGGVFLNNKPNNDIRVGRCNGGAITGNPMLTTKPWVDPESKNFKLGEYTIAEE